MRRRREQRREVETIGPAAIPEPETSIGPNSTQEEPTSIGPTVEVSTEPRESPSPAMTKLMLRVAYERLAAEVPKLKIGSPEFAQKMEAKRLAFIAWNNAK